MAQQVRITDRLVLRRWRDDDHAPFAAICADKDVMKYIGNGSTRTPEQVAQFIESAESAWDKNGYGLFAVELRQTSELIGFAGFANPEFMPELLPSVEIGWRLGKAHWGRGYATEVAREALVFSKQLPLVEEVVSICQVGNDASVRIMEKIGLRFDRRSIDLTCDREVLVYRLPK